MSDQVTRSDQVEFERIKVAKRGTVRLERANDYVIIAHCSTTTRIEEIQIDDTRWYISINYRGTIVTRREFYSTLTYDILDTLIVSAIVAHQKGLKQR